MSNDTRFIYFELPDAERLQAAGEVSLRHGQLDHILRMTIKTLAELPLETALEATERTPSVTLRKRVRRLAKIRIGEGVTLVPLDALLERCRQATARRNELIHGAVGRELDQDVVIRREDHSWVPFPSVTELRALAEHLYRLTLELNDARRNGFLHEALASKRRATR